MPAEVPAQAKG